MTDATMTTEARTEILNVEVARYASKGWTVNSVQGSQAVLSRKKRIGFWWNALFALITGGLWLIVVLVRVVNRKVENLVINVDANGRVSRR
jgi:hypothetical protein